MNTHTQTSEIPVGLKRNADNTLPGEPAKAKVTLATTAAPATAKPEKKAKAPKAAKPAKEAKSKKSTIVATAANPARSIVPVRFKQAYKDHNDTNGSPMALALKLATTHKNKEGRDALDVDALRKIAKANKIDFGPYEKLNNGQKRMNVGNKLAGKVKAGEAVTIAGQTFDKAGAIKAKAKAEPLHAAA